jgi:translation elongation factor EF-4
MEIVSERIRREYGQELITTAPSVVYRFTLQSDEELF